MEGEPPRQPFQSFWGGVVTTQNARNRSSGVVPSGPNHVHSFIERRRQLGGLPVAALDVALMYGRFFYFMI
jgi:hypothetical protein